MNRKVRLVIGWMNLILGFVSYLIGISTAFRDLEINTPMVMGVLSIMIGTFLALTNMDEE